MSLKITSLVLYNHCDLDCLVRVPQEYCYANVLKTLVQEGQDCSSLFKSVLTYGMKVSNPGDSRLPKSLLQDSNADEGYWRSDANETSNQLVSSLMRLLSIQLNCSPDYFDIISNVDLFMKSVSMLPEIDARTCCYDVLLPDFSFSSLMDDGGPVCSIFDCSSAFEDVSLTEKMRIVTTDLPKQLQYMRALDSMKSILRYPIPEQLFGRYPKFDTFKEDFDSFINQNNERIETLREPLYKERDSLLAREIALSPELQTCVGLGENPTETVTMNFGDYLILHKEKVDDLTRQIRVSDFNSNEYLALKDRRSFLRGLSEINDLKIINDSISNYDAELKQLRFCSDFSDINNVLFVSVESLPGSSCSVIMFSNATFTFRDVARIFGQYPSMDHIAKDVSKACDVEVLAPFFKGPDIPFMSIDQSLFNFKTTLAYFDRRLEDYSPSMPSQQITLLGNAVSKLSQRVISDLQDNLSSKGQDWGIMAGVSRLLELLTDNLNGMYRSAYDPEGFEHHYSYFMSNLQAYLNLTFSDGPILFMDDGYPEFYVKSGTEATWIAFEEALSTRDKLPQDVCVGVYNSYFETSEGIELLHEDFQRLCLKDFTNTDSSTGLPAVDILIADLHINDGRRSVINPTHLLELLPHIKSNPRFSKDLSIIIDATIYSSKSELQELKDICREHGLRVVLVQSLIKYAQMGADLKMGGSIIPLFSDTEHFSMLCQQDEGTSKLAAFLRFLSETIPLELNAYRKGIHENVACLNELARSLYPEFVYTEANGKDYLFQLSSQPDTNLPYQAMTLTHFLKKFSTETDDADQALNVRELVISIENYIVKALQREGCPWIIQDSFAHCHTVVSDCISSFRIGIGFLEDKYSLKDALMSLERISKELYSSLSDVEKTGNVTGDLNRCIVKIQKLLA